MSQPVTPIVRTRPPSNLGAARIISLPARIDARGSLAFVEAGQHTPFDIQRVYYLFDVPRDAERGAHAHRELQQLMIAGHGRFDVVLSDGHDARRFVLDDPTQALYVPPMLWRVLENFSEGSFCLVLASLHFDEADYFREYDDYLRAAGAVGTTG